ncbi:MAG: multidrug transporter, partial [Betaproteobacteria bacterium]|nr:multidrug transporter [Betaproteobacteria bacterium]
KPNTHRQEQQAYATVLQIQDLSDARNSYATAQAQLDKAQASLDAARQEYQRLDQLHNDDHNVSDKSFQAGLAAMKTEEANVRAAQTTVQSSANGVIQRYGEVITAWLAADTPAFKRLLQQQDVLIQVTFPANAPDIAPPKTIRVQTKENTFVTASLVSRSPLIDPRIQGIGFFYLAPAQMLVSGMNVLAYLPANSESSANTKILSVIVPQSALVWWQGKAWIYVQKDNEHFVRREVPTDQPVENGFVVRSGLMPDAAIVIGGAQMLLSEEFRSQIQVGEEGAGE